MRQAKWAALLAVVCLVPLSAWAQRPIQPPPRPIQPPGFGPPPRGGDREGRRLARLMDRLRDEMWDYRQELNFFQRAPEYNQLVELRYQLRGLAMRVAEAEENDPQAQRAAREMDQAARELYRLTNRLEQRADLGPREEVRRRADALEERAVEIRVLIGRLHEMVRLDYGGVGRAGLAGPAGGRGAHETGDERGGRCTVARGGA